jgi:hypothetical protein
MFLNRNHKNLATLCALLLFNITAYSEEKEFRGWRVGDWIVASVYLDMSYWENIAKNIKDPIVSIDYLASRPREDTFWCRIEAVSTETLLVTGYFFSKRTVSQVNNDKKREYQKFDPPSKFNLSGNTNLFLVEWVKNTEPPRPKSSWWDFVFK